MIEPATTWCGKCVAIKSLDTLTAISTIVKDIHTRTRSSFLIPSRKKKFLRIFTHFMNNVILMICSNAVSQIYLYLRLVTDFINLLSLKTFLLVALRSKLMTCNTINKTKIT